MPRDIPSPLLPAENAGFQDTFDKNGRWRTVNARNDQFASELDCPHTSRRYFVGSAGSVGDRHVNALYLSFELPATSASSYTRVELQVETHPHSKKVSVHCPRRVSFGERSECDLMPQQVPTIDVDVYGLGLYSTRNGSDLTQLLPSRHTTKGNLLQEPAPGCVGCTGTFFFAGSSKDTRNLAAVQKAPSLVAQLRVHAASNAAQCCVWRHITSFATMHLAWRFVTQAQALSS